MMTMSKRHFLAAVVALAFIGVVSTGLTSPVQGCPFCIAPVLTLVEQYEKADASIVATWVSSQKPEENRSGKTVFRIIQLLNDPSGKLKVGGEITLDRFRAGKANERFLMLATKGDTLEWGSPIEATHELVDYLT